jgi:hypothetical protein
MLRKPWPVIFSESVAKPAQCRIHRVFVHRPAVRARRGSRTGCRRSASAVPSESRSTVSTEGRCAAPSSSFWSRRICHSASSRSNSDHAAFRRSPGRTKRSGSSFRAYFVIGGPWQPSIAQEFPDSLRIGDADVVLFLGWAVSKAPRCSMRRMILSAWLATPVRRECFARHCRVTTSKLFAARSSFATFCRLMGLPILSEGDVRSDLFARLVAFLSGFL